jgi:hypothetical protein
VGLFYPAHENRNIGKIFKRRQSKKAMANIFAKMMTCNFSGKIKYMENFLLPSIVSMASGLFILIAANIDSGQQLDNFKKEAIQKGYAEYTHEMKFQWKETIKN